jgi:hypothetical protein
LLGTALQRTVTQLTALIGRARRRGRQRAGLVDPQSSVAWSLDFNSTTSCSAHRLRVADQFEPVLHDLSQGRRSLLQLSASSRGWCWVSFHQTFCGYLAALLTSDGNFAALLQLPSATLPEISTSAYSSLSRLEPAFSFVHPTSLDDALSARGFSRLASERYEIDSGKSFYYASYQITNAALYIGK